MKKISAILLSLTLLFSFLPVFAYNSSNVQHTGGATLTGNYTDKIEVEFDNDSFFEADIMNPGDTWESIITLKNQSNELNMQVSLVEIKNLLEDADLINELQLEIWANNGLIYSGLYNNSASPVFWWLDLPHNSTLELKVITKFPGEAGNEFQGKPFKAEWIFEVRADEKEVEMIQGQDTENGDSSVDSQDRPVQTGEPLKNFSYVLLGLAGVVVIIAIVYEKKKGDKDNEK